MISGGFDPLHPGHIAYIEAAARLGFVLVVLSTDDQLRKKDELMGFPKHREPILYEVRKEVILWGLKGRGVVVPNVDKDITCQESLRLYEPDIFAKGGDTWTAENLPERAICQELGIEIVFGVGGHDKPFSSSKLGRPYNTASH